MTSTYSFLSNTTTDDPFGVSKITTESFNVSSENTTNISNNDVQSKGELFEAIILGIIGLTGTVGNLLIILTAVFLLRLKRPIHIAILSLAAADFITCALYIPAYGYGVISGGWHISVDICTAAGALFLEQLGVTTMTNLLIAVYSYLAYFKPDKCQAWFTYKHVIIYIAVVWICACLLLLYPVFFDQASILFDTVHLHCQIDFPDDASVSQMIYIYVNTFVIYLVPLFVSGVLYGTLARSLYQSKYIPENGENEKIVKKTIITMGIVYATFIVCWVPHLVMLNFESSVNSVVFRSTTYLLLLNSCLNPFIYGFRLPDFQDAISCICPGRTKKNTNYEPTGGQGNEDVTTTNVEMV